VKKPIISNPLCAVIVPVYRWPLTDSEAFSLYYTVKNLKAWDIYFVGPDTLAKSFPEDYLEKKLQYISFKDECFASIDSYNSLLTSREFYTAFINYKSVLIVQTDALVLRDEIERWANSGYSYIGAPWFEGFDGPTTEYKFQGVGNGGFSMRSVGDSLMALSNPLITRWKLSSRLKSYITVAMRKISSKDVFHNHPGQPQNTINEDLFWCITVPRYCSFFKIPTAEIALQFSFEVAPEIMFFRSNRSLPFGCHAWERYNRSFWINTLGSDFFSLNRNQLLPFIK